MVPDVPPVSYPVGRSAALAAVLAWPVAGGALLAIWACFSTWASALPALNAIILIVVVVVAAGAAWHFWRGQVPRTLHWDGVQWFLGDAAAGGAPDLGQEGASLQVRADAQRWLLLWFAPSGRRGGRWLWAQASADPARWHLLRCALYLPQSSAGQSGASPTDAERA